RDGESQRNVDQKNGAPGYMLNQPTTHHRTDGGSDGSETSPGPNGPASCFTFECRSDNGEASRHQERRACALQRAGRDQLLNVGGERAKQRSTREKRHPEKKYPAPTVTIAQRSAD